MNKLIGATSQQIQLVDFCDKMNIAIKEAWHLIEEGQVLCRMHQGQLVIIEDESDLQEESLLPVTSFDDDRKLESMAEETLNVVRGLERKLEGATSHDRSNVEEQEKLILSLRQEIEDLQILTQALMTKEKY